MANTEQRPKVPILETGNILFFYRPKTDVLHPKSPDDLERAYFMLLPDDQDRHQNRLFNVAHGVFPAIVPGRLLPEERDWAFVQDTARDPTDLLLTLEKEVPVPAPPSGRRIRPWARAAGEGRYAIVKHEDHTELVYRLAEPQKPGEVQKELQLYPEASYVLSVKEPFAPSEIELSEKPSYPKELRARFDGYGWIPSEPTDYLDYQYTQVLLVGARTNPQEEFGLTIDAGMKNRAAQQVLKVLSQKEREAEQQEVSLLEPMKQGRWE